MSPPAASAQTTPTFSIAITESSEVVEAVGTTRRIGRAEIEARNARSLDDALRLIPGIHVRTGGDGTPRVDVRGFRSRHILLLVNGVPVNSTADGQFDPARISTDGIREIKVTYGTGSVLYGDNALAAVIEITTIDDRPDAILRLAGGTPGQQDVGGRVAGTTGNWSFMAAGEAFTTDGFRLPGSFATTPLEDGGRRQNSDRDRRELRTTAGYRFSPSASLGSDWSFGAGRYGVPGTTIDGATDVFAQPPRFERVEDYESFSGQVSLALSPWRRVNLRAWAFRNAQREDRARYDDASYSSMDDPLVQGTFRSRERTAITGSQALARIDLDRFGSLRLSGSQRREAFESGGVIRDVSSTGGSGAGSGGGGRGGGSRPATFDVRAFALDHHLDVYSGGVEWESRPAPAVGVVVGAAVNHQARPDGDGTTAPTWLGGVFWDATDTVRLRGSAARKVRVPSIDQLFNASSGNPSLRAEHAYSVDSGVDYRVGHVATVGLSLYSTNAYDFIERLPGQPFENQDQYRFRGAELTVRTSRISGLDLRGAYSFLDSVDRSAPGAPRLQSRPRHRSSVEWLWTPIRGSAVRGAAAFVSSQLYDSRGAVVIQRRGERYALVDLGVTQALGGRYEVALDVANVFDTLYDQAYALPREGRAAVVTLRARLH